MRTHVHHIYMYASTHMHTRMLACTYVHVHTHKHTHTCTTHTHAHSHRHKHTHTYMEHAYIPTWCTMYCCCIFSRRYQWFCHFDDDVYVNVKQLSNMLQKYNHNKPYYIGRWPHEIFGDGQEYLEVHPQFTCKHYVIFLLFVC